ncbi:14472_t:CDS:2, partial [Dentiscutata heterogama]
KLFKKLETEDQQSLRSTQMPALVPRKHKLPDTFETATKYKIEKASSSKSQSKNKENLSPLKSQLTRGTNKDASKQPLAQKMLKTTNTKWSEEMKCRMPKKFHQKKIQEISEDVDINDNCFDENLSGDEISVDEQPLEQQISNEPEIFKESKMKSKEKSPTALAKLQDAVKGVSNTPKEIGEGSIIEVEDDKSEDHRELTAT